MFSATWIFMSKKTATATAPVLPPFIVGLTGGIASGKTAVSDHFKSLGIDIIDADVVARQVVEKGTPALYAIAERFGNKILNTDGSLDRTALRNIVFNSATDKSWLNELTHPLVRAQMQVQIHAATSVYVVLAVPLLIENGLNAMVDRVLVVDVPESLQIARGAARDNSAQALIQNIINAQASRQQRLELADDIVVNDRDLAHLHCQVDKLHKNYLTLAHKKR